MFTEDDNVLIGKYEDSNWEPASFGRSKYNLSNNEVTFPIQMKDIFGDNSFYREGSLALFE
jgi:hypothetical protein